MYLCKNVCSSWLGAFLLQEHSSSKEISNVTSTFFIKQPPCWNSETSHVAVSQHCTSSSGHLAIFCPDSFATNHRCATQVLKEKVGKKKCIGHCIHKRGQRIIIASFQATARVVVGSSAGGCWDQLKPNGL